MRPLGIPRTDYPTRRPEVRLLAVVIGEPITARTSELQNYPLSPVSPSESLPFALLPICNTPLIDYTLQTLLNNGVDQVTVLLNSTSIPAVRSHLQSNCTSHGKPWCAHDAMKVNTLECTRALTKMADAMNEVRDNNVVPQNSSFLFIPIECVTNIRNLRACFNIHLDRVRTVSQYCATLLCTSVEDELRDSLHNVLVQAMNTDLETSSPSVEPMSPLEQSTVQHVGNFNIRVSDLHLRQNRHSPLPVERTHLHVKTTISHPPEHHTMFVVNTSNQVITYMARFRHEEELLTEPPLLTFSSFKSSDQRVRLDLVPTQYLFCTAESLRLMLEDHMSDIYMCLSTGLLGKVELLGNVFGLVEVGPSVEVATLVCPIHSLESYLQCNVDVSARRLAPCTRDSCFAEPQIRYAVVSSLSLLEEYSTVYVHNSVTLAHAYIGPHVVIGPDASLASSASLSGVSCGARCTIGEGSLLVNCVLLDDVIIGCGCTLRNVLIGNHTMIKDHAELSNSIIGPHCVIGRVRANVKSKDALVTMKSVTNTQNVNNITFSKNNDNDNNNTNTRKEEHFNEGSKGDSSNNNSNSNNSSTHSRHNTEVHAPIIIHNQAIYSTELLDGDMFSESTSNIDDNDSDANNINNCESESKNDRNDVNVVGVDGKGKVLDHRWSSAISPTSALFADHMPRSASMKRRGYSTSVNCKSHPLRLKGQPFSTRKRTNSGTNTNSDVEDGNDHTKNNNTTTTTVTTNNNEHKYRNNNNQVWEEEDDEDEDEDEDDGEEYNCRNHNADEDEIDPLREWEREKYGDNTNGVYEEDDEEDEEDEEDEVEEDEEDQYEQFRRRITALAHEALLDPKLISVRSFDMGQECVGVEHGYADMCEIVTELLIEHVLQEHARNSSICAGNSNNNNNNNNRNKHEYGEEEVDEVVNAARKLFGEWCVPFYNNFLSRYDKEMIDGMVTTLTGLCTAISDPSCILHRAAPELVEILYNDCDEDMYDKRGYCIVSGKALLQFDEDNCRQRCWLNSHRYTEYDDDDDDDTLSSNNGEGANKHKRNKLYDSEDEREELCLRVGESCHDFIMGVKEFLNQCEEQQ